MLYMVFGYFVEGALVFKDSEAYFLPSIQPVLDRAAMFSYYMAAVISSKVIGVTERNSKLLFFQTDSQIRLVAL